MESNVINTRDVSFSSVYKEPPQVRPKTGDPAEQKPLLLENDSVELSEEAKRLLEQTRTSDTDNNKNNEDSEKAEEVQHLEERDKEVRQHEQAHKSVGGSYAGPIVYEYRTGPDGKRYATGGHVDFYMSKESNPQATIRKAETIYRAAMAPSDPSTADMNVAKSAQRLKREAQIELQEQQEQQSSNAMEDSSSTVSNQNALDAVNIV